MFPRLRRHPKINNNVTSTNSAIDTAGYEASSVWVRQEMVLVGAMCLPPTGALPKLPLEVVVPLLSQDGSDSVVGAASAGV